MTTRSPRFVAAAIAACCAAVFTLGATGSVDARATIGVTANSALGSIVVSSTGRTLYHFTGDRGKKVACTGACASQWPPVLVAKGTKPVGGAGLTTSKLGTLDRPDGTVQVTYNGFTLYRFAGDAKKGQVNGEGLEHKWFALAPSGALVKSAPASSSGGSASTGTMTTPSTTDPGTYTY